MSSKSKGNICIICKKSFTQKSTLYRHIRSTHGNNTETFVCYQCKKGFNRKYSLIRHFPNCGNNKSKKGNVICPICKHEDSYEEMLKHFGIQHNIEIGTQTLKFESISEFEKWKDDIESTSISKFIKYSMGKRKKATTHYYKCHREGFFKTKGKNIRHLKRSGSNKINGHCPAKMDVRVRNDNGEVSVSYVKTHVGHLMELDKIPLKKSDKDTLASKLAQKVSFDEILNNIKSNNTNENKYNRLHLLKRQDLFNIERQYNISSSVRRSNDCSSVESWVKEISDNSCESVIKFYKGQEQVSYEFPELRKSDFLLILMNEVQQEMLKKFGNYCICVDTTKGISRQNFELTSIMVLDDSWQGFPCLFVFSNRFDVTIFKIVFNIMKNTLGIILSPSIFMSDVVSVFHKAWSEVMGPVNHRLFCTWHMLRTMKKNIDTKIRNTEKQTATFNMFKALLEEQNEVSFEKIMENFIAHTKNDKDVANFGQHFAKNYHSTRKLWACCYRTSEELNANVHLEQMHLALRHIYLKGKTANRLDKAINAIMKLVRSKLNERCIIILRGEFYTEINELKERHKTMESVRGITQMIEEQNGTWSVVSDGNEKFTIEKSKTDCRCELRCLDCDTCIHAYICSCADSSVKWNMCKHIHLLAHYPKFTTLQNYISNAHHNSDSDDEHPELIFLNTIESETVLGQAALLNSVLPKVNCPATIDNLDTDRARLLQTFQAIMEEVTTREKCKVLENSLLLTLQTFKAMDSVNGKLDNC